MLAAQLRELALDAFDGLGELAACLVAGRAQLLDLVASLGQSGSSHENQPGSNSILEREIVRPAVLLAARQELGLGTRDAPR